MYRFLQVPHWKSGPGAGAAASEIPTAGAADADADADAETDVDADTDADVDAGAESAAMMEEGSCSRRAGSMPGDQSGSRAHRQIVVRCRDITVSHGGGEAADRRPSEEERESRRDVEEV